VKLLTFSVSLSVMTASIGCMNTRTSLLTSLAIGALQMTVGAQDVESLEPNLLFQEIEALEVRQGELTRTTPWIELPNPLVSLAACEITIESEEASVAGSDGVRIQLELEGEDLIELVSLAIGDVWPNTKQFVRTLPGELAITSIQASRARFHIEAVSGSNGTIIQIDRLRLEERGMAPEGLPREVTEKARFHMTMIDPKTGVPTLNLALEDLSQNSLPFQIRYIPRGGGPIDMDQLGDDDICLGNERTEFLDHEFKVRFIRAELQPEAIVLATYELPRPPEGWSRFEFYWAIQAYVCYDKIEEASAKDSTTLGFVGKFSFDRPFKDLRVVGEPRITDRDQTLLDVDVLMHEDIVGPEMLKDGDIFLQTRGDQHRGFFLETSPQEDGSGFIASYPTV
jgi:hypothetical protein